MSLNFMSRSMIAMTTMIAMSSSSLCILDFIELVVSQAKFLLFVHAKVSSKQRVGSSVRGTLQ
jgi:hypothetical protein